MNKATDVVLSTVNLINNVSERPVSFSLSRRKHFWMRLGEVSSFSVGSEKRLWGNEMTTQMAKLYEKTTLVFLAEKSEGLVHMQT